MRILAVIFTFSILLIFLTSWLVQRNSGAAVCAATAVDDSFDGTVLDRCKWDESSQSGGQFSVNGQLVATTSSGSGFSIPRITSQYRLTGNFDYQIDYAIGSGWTGSLPSGSYLEIQLGVYWDDSRSVFISRGRDDGGGEYIKPYTSIAGQQSINSIRIPFSQSSGKFRAVRTGSSLTMKFFDGAVWQDLATTTVPTDDAYIYLGAISGNAFRAFSASFDNFLLNSGPTSFRSFVPVSQFQKRSDFYVGGVVCDSLAHRTWGDQWQGINPLDSMRQNGFRWARVGVTTVSSSYLTATPVAQWSTLPWRDEYWSSREYAGELMRQAQAKGYRLDLFLFLSNTAAHAGQQNAPPEWAGLSVADTAQRLDQYSFDTTKYYMDRGLNIELYDIGNEIDFGILNFRPGDRIPIPPGTDITNNMDYMRNNIWNIEAQLLQASINGIKRANPNAKIVLHASGINISRSNVFVKTFFKTMVEYGVQFDYAGLSNPYNASNWSVPSYTTSCWFQRLQEIIDYCAGLNKKVIFSEASYPHDPNGTLGQPMPEFPYSDSGQAAWAREHLRFLSNQSNVLGFFWFYPDYHMNIVADPALKGSSLFQTPNQPVPAMSEFRVNLDRPPFNFDGDGKTDIGITRANGGIKEWWLSRSSDSNVFSTVFGLDSDISAPGDFTGDGKTDIAVFRPSTGQWFVLRSEDFSFFAFPFGANGDIPVPADYDGDGKTDPAVFRPSSNTWFISRTSDGQTTIAQFGAAGDKPVPADYDGDGKADIAVYRANNGPQEWWIQRSTAGLFATVFGIAGDKAVAGDYTGDGKTDIAVWRPSNGNWFVLRSEDFSFFAFPWGANGDIPAPGDYDGDGKTDAAVFRQSGATWFINRTGGAGPLITGFGAATDSPVAGTFVR